MKSDIIPGMRKHKSQRMMTIQEFRERFGEEEQCWKHLTSWRWPRGFVCPRCGGGSRGYMKAKRVQECRTCGYQGSVTAGTILHKTRVPLRDWFWAIYRLSQGKKGISALQLSKEIGVGYPTAWLMQHKIRRAMMEGERGRPLSGLVEVDEGYVGGAEKGSRGRGPGKASQVDGGDGGGASPCRKAGAEVLAGPLGDGGGERSRGWDSEGFCAKQGEAGQRGVDRCLVELP